MTAMASNLASVYIVHFRYCFQVYFYSFLDNKFYIFYGSQMEKNHSELLIILLTDYHFFYV